MDNETRIRMSWYAFLLVGALFLIFGYGKLFEPGPPYDDPLGGEDAIYEFAQIAAIPLGALLFLGLLGFYSFYSARARRSGKIGWALMFIGSLAIFLGGLVYIPSRDNLFWQILVYGNFITAFGLLFVGYSSYRNKLFPRWNWSPFIVGVLYTAVFIAGSLDPSYEAGFLTGVVIFLLTALGWIWIGRSLRECAVI